MKDICKQKRDIEKQNKDTGSRDEASERDVGSDKVR